MLRVRTLCTFVRESSPPSRWRIPARDARSEGHDRDPVAPEHHRISSSSPTALLASDHVPGVGAEEQGLDSMALAIRRQEAAVGEVSPMLYDLLNGSHRLTWSPKWDKKRTVEHGARHAECLRGSGRAGVHKRFAASTLEGHRRFLFRPQREQFESWLVPSALFFEP